jgi:hypothetical protein
MKLDEPSDYQKETISSRMRHTDSLRKDYAKERRVAFWEKHRGRLEVVLGFAIPLLVLPFLLFVTLTILQIAGVPDFFENLVWGEGILIILAKGLLLASLVSTLIYFMKKIHNPNYSLGQFPCKKGPHKISETTITDDLAVYGHLALVAVGISFIIGFGVGSILNFVYPHNAAYALGGAAGFFSLVVLTKLD